MLEILMALTGRVVIQTKRRTNPLEKKPRLLDSLSNTTPPVKLHRDLEHIWRRSIQSSRSRAKPLCFYQSLSERNFYSASRRKRCHVSAERGRHSLRY